MNSNVPSTPEIEKLMKDERRARKMVKR